MKAQVWGQIRSLVLALTVALGVAGAYAHEHADETAGQNRDSAVSVTTADYAVPNVQLVREDGKVISLPDEMNDGRPVVLNFIFTSCTSICPLLSAVFAEFDRQLGRDRNKVHLMSISIDPEADTPAHLREYASRFKPGPEWHHYTGTLTASLAAQRAFNVYRGDKMNHTPVTLLRAAPGQPWLRLEGFVTPHDLLVKYRRLTEAPPHAIAAR
ncbi:MAG TPA: SCO family protein [Steroidobacteraceae bacterium]|nr:SCO family protein [Steroidobacteraceae bacterium]